MKKKLFLTVVFVITLFLYSCGETENPVTNNGGQNSGDTTFTAYVILSLGGNAVDTLYFTDRNLCTGSYSSSQNNTYCLLNDTTSSQSISVSFTGNTAGNPPFTFGFLSYQSGSFNGSNITGTVTLYEGVGGKIKGTYTGTFSDGVTSYSVSAVFTVTRTM